jgi:uncharacterized protein (DUF885 family)
MRCFAVACFIVSWSAIWSAAASAQTSPLSDAERLHQLFQSEWEYTLQQNPTWASQLGDRRFNDRWPDLSPRNREVREQHDRSVLRVLTDEIHRDKLPPADALNYDLFRRRYEMIIEGFPLKWELIPLDQRSGIQAEDGLVDTLRFETPKDYEDYIARLRSFPKYMDETMQIMREGIEAHMVQPKIVMQRVPAQIDKQIVDDPKTSRFFLPFERMPKSFSNEQIARYRSEGEGAIKTSIVPAYKKFREFFSGDYLPACLDNIGVWRLPNGQKLYQHFIREHTTTNLSADEIHDIGLREVERIDREMDEVMKSTGFAGTREQFFQFLRTDKRFYYSNGEELLAASRALCKRIDPKLVKLIKTIPRMPYGVEPIPENMAPDTTTAYFQPGAADGSRAGTYYVNLYRPDTRPKWEMVALTLHEAVPGHHLQIARAMELGEMPQFRKYEGYSAYVEGWALYCESLGDEIGMYEDPYDRFGKLTYEMWRAVRLVVDTGIHHKHWPREQAIEYFKAHAAKSELDITNEVDRYIAWPGQALAYKIGELKIKELRARATKDMGERFDEREFHDVILGQGALPLDVLERFVNDWITKTK